MSPDYAVTVVKLTPSSTQLPETAKTASAMELAPWTKAAPHQASASVCWDSKAWSVTSVLPRWSYRCATLAWGDFTTRAPELAVALHAHHAPAQHWHPSTMFVTKRPGNATAEMASAEETAPCAILLQPWWAASAMSALRGITATMHQETPGEHESSAIVNTACTCVDLFVHLTRMHK